MKKYESPELELKAFHTDDVMASGIQVGDNELPPIFDNTGKVSKKNITF